MQSKPDPYRALVVDDEQVARKMLIFHLIREGFECHSAADGVDALELCKTAAFDLIVTDLRMPNMHGHALATALLDQPSPPLVVVHTAVLEPRIAKDMLIRGVDDIVFKPTDYGVFAAKMKILVARRRGESPGERLAAPRDNSNSGPTGVSPPALQ